MTWKAFNLNVAIGDALMIMTSKKSQIASQNYGSFEFPKIKTLLTGQAKVDIPQAEPCGLYYKIFTIVMPLASTMKLRS